MSMYRARNHRNRWQRRWPWRMFFPPRVNERFCPECELPFHDGPLPKEANRIFVNDLVAYIFPSGGYRKGEFVVRLGRWRTGGKQFYASEFIPFSELEDLQTLIEQIQEQHGSRQTGGREKPRVLNASVKK